MIDLELGNLRSVINAFGRIGAEIKVVSRAEDLEQGSPIILPGVGAFETAMDSLKQKGMVEVLKRRVMDEGAPLLGICLGMQLLADASEENGDHDGLGLIPGRVEKLQSTEPGFRVPNIGWYDVQTAKPDTFFPDGSDGKDFYFVHSYHYCCKDPNNISATIEYSGNPITAAIQKDSIFGIQFHPEKSQDAGIDLLNTILTHLKNSGRL